MKFPFGLMLAPIAIPLCLAPLNAACGASEGDEEEASSASSAIDATKFPSGTYSVTAGTAADGATIKATIKWKLAADGMTGDAQLTGTATDTKSDTMAAFLRVQYGGATEYKDLGRKNRSVGETSETLTWSSTGIKKFPYVTACAGVAPANKAKPPVCKGGKTTLLVKDAPGPAPDAGPAIAVTQDAGTAAEPTPDTSSTPAPIPTPPPSPFVPPPITE